MPELPEVETIKRQLIHDLLARTIKDIIVHDQRILKNITKEKFIKEVKNQKVKAILRKGKVLIIELANSWFIVIHLRISGWIIVSNKEERFARVVLKLDNNQLFNFCDSRLLGELKLVKDWQSLPIIQTMGKEVFDISKEDFISLFKNKKTKIKPLLLDQKFIAGIGNIYAQEALFCSGIHPEKISADIDNKRLDKLYDCLKNILNQAIKNGGSSVDTYRQVSGQEGSYAKLLKVYQRGGQDCLNCKAKIQSKTIGGRGTCFCPQCQK